MVEDRRRERRTRTFKGGKIVFNNDHSIIDCIVKNVSAGGATLQLESTVGIPGRFKLTISPDGVTKLCRIAWLTETQIGVAFLED